MDAIERAAYISVARACGFAWLAIFCIAFSLSFQPPLAAFAGGVLCLGVCLILMFYALRARRRPYRRTELWLMLAKEHRPEPAIAQKIIGQVLRETYLRFARQAVLFAVVFLTVSVALRAIGFEHLPTRERSVSMNTVVGPKAILASHVKPGTRRRTSSLAIGMRENSAA